MKKAIILFIFMIIAPIIMAGCGVCDCQKRPTEYVEIQNITIFSKVNTLIFYPSEECNSNDIYIMRNTYMSVSIKYKDDFLIVKTVAFDNTVEEHEIDLRYKGVLIRY